MTGCPCGTPRSASVDARRPADLFRRRPEPSPRGEVAAQLNLPAGELLGARLKVSVQSRTAQETVEETVNVRSAVRTLLTTDKPLYQPGQTIHLCALSLRRPSMAPLAGAAVRRAIRRTKAPDIAHLAL